MPAALPLTQREKAIIAVALSWAAGFIDVIGYLTLYHAFAAHMTGNTIATMMNSVEHRWDDVLHRGVRIGMFMVGLLLGEVMLEYSKRWGDVRIAARATGNRRLF